jgi:hypothetical protein
VFTVQLDIESVLQKKWIRGFPVLKKRNLGMFLRVNLSSLVNEVGGFRLDTFRAHIVGAGGFVLDQTEP